MVMTLVNEDERSGGLKVRVETGREAAVLDARQAEALREYLGTSPRDHLSGNTENFQDLSRGSAGVPGVSAEASGYAGTRSHLRAELSAALVVTKNGSQSLRLAPVRSASTRFLASAAVFSLSLAF
jgi:hypothetical protein